MQTNARQPAHAGTGAALGVMTRLGRRPATTPYWLLAATVVLVNVVLVLVGTALGWFLGTPEEVRATVLVFANVNLAVAVAARTHLFINALLRVVTWVPPKWPLPLRWALAKVYHHGGLHVGAAISGTIAHFILVALLLLAEIRGEGVVNPAIVAVSWAFVALLLAMVATALPPLRAKRHDLFEVMHRFGGWTAIVLAWMNTVLLLGEQLGDNFTAAALLTAPQSWLLLVITSGIALPWLQLRRVPVTVERPSRHVALVQVHDSVSPTKGSTVPVSRHPLYGWHGFATVPPGHAAGGYRLAVSRAGDWTGAFIDNPPKRLWVRGVPVLELLNMRQLFTGVLLVATGSGIGPMMRHIESHDVPAHLVWITRSPRLTYGDALVDEILAARPDAAIWDTDERGKPDVLELAHEQYRTTGAEAVFCVSNERVTREVVHGLERRGIPAFGPIFDS